MGVRSDTRGGAPLPREVLRVSEGRAERSGVARLHARRRRALVVLVGALMLAALSVTGARAAGSPAAAGGRIREQHGRGRGGGSRRAPRGRACARAFAPQAPRAERQRSRPGRRCHRTLGAGPGRRAPPERIAATRGGAGGRRRGGHGSGVRGAGEGHTASAETSARRGQAGRASRAGRAGRTGAIRRPASADRRAAPGHRRRRAGGALLALQRRRLQQRRGGLLGPGRRNRARQPAGSVLPGLPGAPVALPVRRGDRLRASPGRLVRTRRGDHVRRAVRARDVRAGTPALRRARRAHRSGRARAHAVPRRRQPSGPARRPPGVLHDGHALRADPLRALGPHALAVLRRGDDGPLGARQGAERDLLRCHLRVLRALARDPRAAASRADLARGHGDHDRPVPARPAALGTGRDGRKLPGLATRAPAEPQPHLLPD